MTTPPTKICGSCSLCCKVMLVEELQKPQGVWRGHFKGGVGCSIHDSHPYSCGVFQCLWILSPTMPIQARPDRLKVVMEIDDGGKRILARADPDHPGAWRQPLVYGQLKQWARDGWPHGRTVWAMVNRHMWLISPNEHADVDVGVTDPRSPFVYQQGPDGRVSVTVLPPLAEGETYDPDATMAKAGWTPPKISIPRRD